MTAVDTILAHAAARRDESRARWFDWLRIPSVSAQPDHAPDCRRAAEWMAAQLRGIGFTAELKETAGHPVVLGHHPGPAGATRHLLFYGHYDVQPAEPMELWTTALRTCSCRWPAWQARGGAWRGGRQEVLN